MREGNATPHFPWCELACHDGTDVPEALMPRAILLCEFLELVREDWGGPLLVISGYRTPEYNERVGGVPHSQHLRAMAADVRPISIPRVPELNALVLSRMKTARYLALGGLGTYPQWVHLDVRARSPDGQVARWYGTGVGSEK